jgi:hypothetical protein
MTKREQRELQAFNEALFELIESSDEAVKTGKVVIHVYSRGKTRLDATCQVDLASIPLRRRKTLRERWGTV